MDHRKLSELLRVPEDYLRVMFTQEELDRLTLHEIKQRLWERVDQDLKRSERKRRLAFSMQDCGVFHVWKKTPHADLPGDLAGLVEKFLSGDKAFFIMYGDVGTYKTRWLLKISHELYLKHLDFKRNIYPSCEKLFFLSWSEFVSSSHLKEEKARELFDKALRTELLFVDDFLAGVLSDYYTSLAFLLISERYTHTKKTFITTNVDFSSLRKTAQDDLLRLTDRLLDVNLSVLYRVSGKSTRTGHETVSTLTDSLKVALGI